MSDFAKKIILIQLICIGLALVICGITLLSNPKPAVVKESSQEPNAELNGDLKLKEGLRYKLYKTESLQRIPDSVNDLELISNAVSTRLSVSIVPVSDRINFYIEFEGFLYSDSTVQTTFYLTSDDGSQLYINDELVVDNDGRHSSKEASGQTSLLYGYNRITLKMFNNANPCKLLLEYGTEAQSRTAVEDSRLYHEAETSLPQGLNKLESFSFLTGINQTLITDIKASINSGAKTITALLPAQCDVTNLIPTFKTSGKVFVDDMEIISGKTSVDFSSPRTIKLVFGEETKTYTTQIRVLDTGLPCVAFTTFGNEPINSKDKYVHSTLRIAKGSVDYGSELEATYVDIKGRGNYSWTGEKKPYDFKFEEPTSLLDLPPEKSWVLIASHLDLSLIRNYIAYDTARFFTALDYSPKMRFVDLFVNGKYLGNYMLGDHIAISENKLNLTETDEPDTGCILELEAQHRAEGKRDYDYFFTKGGWSVTYKDPNDENLTTEQRRFIRDYYEKAEAAILSLDHYEDYIDVDSFVDWFLVETLFKNWDSQFTSSIYLHKDAGGKLKMGPVWDFDCAVANQDMIMSFTEIEGWEPRWGTWFETLLKDPKFRSKLSARWKQMKPVAIDTLNARIDATAKIIEKSYIENYKVYPLLGVGIWPVPYFLKPLDTQKEQTDFIKDWMTRRIAWLDNEFKKPVY